MTYNSYKFYQDLIGLVDLDHILIFTEEHINFLKKKTPLWDEGLWVIYSSELSRALNSRFLDQHLKNFESPGEIPPGPPLFTSLNFSYLRILDTPCGEGLLKFRKECIGVF